MEGKNLKNIYLTFDDGPNEPYTSQILQILGQFGAEATFFVCGKNLETHPESLKHIAAAGHTVGNHSYSHNIWKVLGGAMAGEIKKTNEIIKNQTGLDVKLYRSPKGLAVPWLKPWLAKNGFKVYHWDIMAFDWKQPPAEFISSHVLARAFPGAIILLHDGDEIKSGSREQTVEALPVILSQLAAQGYSFKKLPPDFFAPSSAIKNLIIDNLAWVREKFKIY